MKRVQIRVKQESRRALRDLMQGLGLQDLDSTLNYLLEEFGPQVVSARRARKRRL